MKNSIISIILIVAIFFTFNVIALAVEQEKAENFIDNRIISFVDARINASKININVSSIKTLLDFGGNEYKLVECFPTGYYIIHPESGIVVENSPSAKSPYNEFSSNLYYGGPTYYYVKTGQDYIHTVMDTTIDNSKLDTAAKTCNEINSELISQINTSVASYLNGDYSELPSTVNRAGIDYWVTSHEWFQELESDFGYVGGGYCGYIASNLILKYFHDEANIDLPSEYSEVDSTDLTNELIDISDDLGYGASTWAYEISDVINEFCSQQDLPEEASWAVAGTGITTEIGTNERPCIIFGNLEGAGNMRLLLMVTIYMKTMGMILLFATLDGMEITQKYIFMRV